MSTLILRWRRVPPPVAVRWAGPDVSVSAAPDAVPPMPVAAIVGPPGVPGGLPPGSTRSASSGAGDAGKLVALGPDGRLDATMLPPRTDVVLTGGLHVGTGSAAYTGSGLEILGGGSAVVQAYDRDQGAYISLSFDASNVYFRPNGAVQLWANPDGVFLPGGGVRVNGGGALGFAPGSGGVVQQAGSKAQPVTLNRPCGRIVMAASSLPPGAAVAFVLNSTAIGADDVVIVGIAAGATALSYQVQVEAVAAGSCRIALRNVGAVALSEAIALNFVVLKGATA